MTSTYDSTGIVVDRYADIKTRLKALAVEKWGASIDTDDDGFLGHIIDNKSLIVGETNEVLQSVYDGQSIANATGVPLDNLVELVGITRQSSAYSTVTLTLTATAATTVPAGSRYATDTDVIFETDNALVFTGPGSDTVEATCTEIGPFNAAAGEVDVIKTAVYGISACTNVDAAVPGRDRETDSELKVRHAVATETSGEQSVSSVYEAVSAVTGVSNLYVGENDTNATAADGTPAHNIHVVVIGGSDDDVATAIANNKGEGVPTYGTDENIEVYNSTTGQTRTINFDRATEVPIYVSLEVTKQTGIYPTDGDDQVTAALVAHAEDYKIGDDVIYSELYRPVYGIPGLIVNAMYIGLSPSPSGTATLAISTTELATITSGTIDITET